MAVYVDKTRHHYGRMVMCHMCADTIDELYAMVDKIGVARRWIQNYGIPHSGISHYDICLSKRKLALRYGAIEVDSKWLVNHMKSVTFPSQQV